MFGGSIELMKQGMNLEIVSDLLSQFVKAIYDSVIESLDIETSGHLLESLSTITEWLLKKSKEGVDISLA